MVNKMFYAIAGFIVGFVLASAFFLPSSNAQYGMSSGGWNEARLKPSVPSQYGALVAASDLNLYFQAKNGDIYVVRQRTGNELDPRVMVITRQ